MSNNLGRMLINLKTQFIVKSEMMEYLRLALGVSRFRFWLYLGGTYFAGFIIGTHNLSDLGQFSFLYQLFYFMVPANIFLYGINDLFDQDTDQFNIKKETKEIRIEEKLEVDRLKIILVFTQLFSVLLLFVLNSWTERVIFLIFLFLSYGYSSPPFRFKSKPFLDFFSNILYGIPGILGYYETVGELPPGGILIALLLWTGAMHLFSAIPDIEADKKANLITTAVLLGKRLSLVLCTIFWLVAISITIIGYSAFTPLSYLTYLYPLIPVSILVKKDIDIDRIYWLYPYINGFVGFAISVLGGWEELTQLFELL